MGEERRSVEYLVERVKEGEIVLPEMQRGYIWRNPKVCNLLDSLYRNYPSGTILTWEPKQELATRDFAVSQKEDTTRPIQLLLDGQQRLTSLLAVIHGKPVQVRGRSRNIDIMFNLEHSVQPSDKDYDNEEDGIDANDEEQMTQLEKTTFMVKNRQLEKIPHWVSVTEVFKSKDNLQFLLDQGVVEDLNDESVKKYNQRLTKLREIKNYEYAIHMLERDQSYEDVTEIFVRINSLGAKLTGSDLALAQITAKWQNSLIKFETFQDECKRADFNIDLGIIVRNLISFATGSSNSKNLPSLKQEKLEQAWKDSIKGFEHAIDFLKNNVNIHSPILLSSPYILIALAYFFHHNKYRLSSKDEKKLKYWVLIANAKGHYSRGSIYTFLDQDLKDIKDSKGLDTMIESLDKHFGLLIKETDLKNKNSRSAYFKTMFLVFHKDGAKDWDTRLEMSFKNLAASNKLQFHHIFPQGLLKKRTDDTQKINDICNLAFISAGTNNDISDKLPSDYLPEFGKDVLASQQVPTNAALWEMDKYEDFLQARRKLVVARLNKFLNHESIK